MKKNTPYMVVVAGILRDKTMDNRLVYLIMIIIIGGKF